jgi:hypothetical protein
MLNIVMALGKGDAIADFNRHAPPTLNRCQALLSLFSLNAQGTTPQEEFYFFSNNTIRLASVLNREVLSISGCPGGL